MLIFGFLPFWGTVRKIAWFKVRAHGVVKETARSSEACLLWGEEGVQEMGRRLFEGEFWRCIVCEAQRRSSFNLGCGVCARMYGFFLENTHTQIQHTHRVCARFLSTLCRLLSTAVGTVRGFKSLAKKIAPLRASKARTTLTGSHALFCFFVSLPLNPCGKRLRGIFAAPRSNASGSHASAEVRGISHPPSPRYVRSPCGL